jgi:hypothetical protein
MAPGQAHALQRLGLDQRQRLARLRALGGKVPVALNALTGERNNRPGRQESLA